MQIIRVESNVRKSTVDGTKVVRLPKGLRIRMIRLLNRLERVKRIDIKGRAENALFEFPYEIVDLTFNERIEKEFLRTVNLLCWYLTPHWRSMSPPGTIGGNVQCADCDYTTVAGGARQYCPAPSCPSHKKWRMVIGPSYEPPEEDHRFSGELPLLRR